LAYTLLLTLFVIVKDIKITVKHFVLFSLLAIFGFIQPSIAQSISPITFPVNYNGKVLKYPFAGGLTAPQFSQADLNNDGAMDLVVFDRTGDVVLPFIASGNNQFEYAPGLVKNFPSPRAWMLMKDFDQDGVMDIFMAPTVNGIAGVEVQRGIIVNNELTFELASQTDDGFNVIYVPLGNIETQVFNSLIDIPGIDDVDNDGDVDIVSFEPGGSTITYYRNYSVERTGKPGIDFRIEQDCFGLIVESGFSEEINLSVDGVTCGNFLLEDHTELRHAGSTVTLFDENNDSIMDALIGDISNDGIVLLKNMGTIENAWFGEQDTNFPNAADPIEINIFNTAFILDLNEDSESDMIVAPNEQSGLQTTNHIWHYEFTDTSDGISFELKTKNFLVDEMLYFGKDAAPTFLDYNADGLMDILIGGAGLTDFNNVRNPKLILLKNIGTIDNPSFELEDDDYLNFSRFVTTSTHFFPAVGDLDNDDDMDLLIGDDNGFFYFVENIAGPNATFQFGEPVYEYQNLNPGQFVKPTIFDFNNDGLNDLVVGERNFNSVDNVNGSLNYIQNIGSSGSPLFSMDHPTTNQTFGNVFTKDQGYIRNLSAPFAFTSEGQTKLMVGTESGRTRYLKDIDDNLDGIFTVIDTVYGNISIGEHTMPAVFDLDNDGFVELLIGNRRGGLTLHSTGIISEIRSSTEDELVDFTLLVYPNPTSERITIDTDQTIERVELIDMSGRIVRTANSGNLEGLHSFSGTHFLKIYTDVGIKVKKIILINE
jgi:hypothetical protein